MLISLGLLAFAFPVQASAGSLTYTTPFSAGSFPAATLTGARQLKNATVNAWAITDSSGTGAGWNVTIAASRFTCSSTGAACRNGVDQFPSGSMTLATAGTPTTDPNNLLGVPPIPEATPSPIDSGSTQQIAHALALLNNGAGTWTFPQQPTGLTLTVPASIAPGTYTSTITTTLASGP